MTYEEWERTVPQEFRDGTVWRVEAYRLSLFAADIGWEDVTVQFGLPYGVANRTGQPNDAEARAIVAAALDGGVNCFDRTIEGRERSA